MYGFVSALMRGVIATPFYPHWLDFRNKKKGNHRFIPYFRGVVLETGAGNCEKKQYILSHPNAITKYVATDYSSWDQEFVKQSKKISWLGSITTILYGPPKQPEQIDVVCDAMKLPFADNTFHTYCNFEVLEHIPNPEQLFTEAYRVLKPGGYCLTTTPYLYREHGGIEFDFQRVSRGGFYELARRTGFEVVEVCTESYFGTTMAILINQYLIRKILEGSWLIKIILFPISPFVFFTTNVMGWLIELCDKDIRFASAYHCVMRKPSKSTSKKTAVRNNKSL